MSPTPPPSYMDIYPDLAENRPLPQSPTRPLNTEERFPPISLNNDDVEAPVDDPDSIQYLEPYSLDSPDRQPSPAVPSIACQDEIQLAPSLGSTLRTADDFEWNSIASFPSERESTPFPRVSSSASSSTGRLRRSQSSQSLHSRVFTISSTRRGRQDQIFHVMRPTTC